MINFELTDIAKEVITWVEKEGHPNDVHNSSAPQEVKDFIDKHSCGDGFGYAMWNGGYAKPEDWITDYDSNKFTVEQLTEFKEIWEKNTLEL